MIIIRGDIYDRIIPEPGTISKHEDGDRDPMHKRCMPDYVERVTKYSEDVKKYDAGGLFVYNKLLDISGDRVYLQDNVCRYYLDHSELCKYGKIREKQMKFDLMIPNRCYDNSVCLSKRIGGNVAVGYAWRDDEREWRAHAWVEKNNVIHETTSPRDLYFGYRVGREGKRQTPEQRIINKVTQLKKFG